MLRGTLMEITKPSGEFLWLSILDEKTERFWVYDFETKKFHMNKGLTLDYEIDGELTYKGIDMASAKNIVETRDRKVNPLIRAMHRDDPEAVPVEDVLRDDAAPNMRDAAKRKAQAIALADAGKWVTWKCYSRNQEARARVAASDIRQGKIKTLTKIAGPVEARTVRHSNGDIEVQVCRTPASRTTTKASSKSAG
jgi:hypothetical protein